MMLTGLPRSGEVVRHDEFCGCRENGRTPHKEVCAECLARIAGAVTKAEALGLRPKRQITLSTKAQELLAAERAAQMEAILQVRTVTLQLE